MDLFHITRYKLYNKNVNKDLRLCIINDIHFSHSLSQKKLAKIIDKIVLLRPDYILLPGDLMDSTDILSDKKEEKRLLEWLKELGMVAPTFISLGGHDFYKKNTKDKYKKWDYNFPKKFITKANKIDDIHILDNLSFEDDNIFVTGYTQSMKYYHPDSKKRSTIFHPIAEDKNLMLRELKLLNAKGTDAPDNKIKMILVHSPIYLNDPDIERELEKYDYFFSGHMHNGCVPPILYEIWNSKRGFIAPNMRLFSNNERNTLKNKEDKLIVNGPITTFHECSGIFQNFNFLYPSYMSVVDFTNDEEYDTKKVYKKKNYYK